MTKGTTTLGISEISLSVHNLEGTLDFFDALGFHRLQNMEDDAIDHAMILTDGFVIITLLQIEQEKAHLFDPDHNVGLNHLSIRIASTEDFQSLYEKVLLVRGVKSGFAPVELKGTNTIRAMVHDPSGIPIYLTCNRE